jgi:hypothetical protein
MNSAERGIDASKLARPQVETQSKEPRELRIDGSIVEQLDIPTTAQAAFTARWSCQDIDSIRFRVADDCTIS